MNRPRGKSFQQGNKTAKGGARPRSGPRPHRLKVMMADLLDQIITDDGEHRTLTRKALDTVIRAMDAKDILGNTAPQAVKAAELVLAYGFGQPRQKIELDQAGPLEITVRHVREGLQVQD